jgi:RNA polymerase sigma-70 factor, ECF subfamily
MISSSDETDVSDEALMLRYQRGDRAAFVALLRRHQLAVYNFVLRQLGSALFAGEIAQDVFLGALRDAARFDYETPFATRLFTIACRLVREERARMPARPRVQHASGPPESGLARGARLAELSPEAVEESIAAAVEDMPEEQKDVYLLREVADLPFSEISAITRQSETTVKIQMQHALQRLRLAVQDFDEYRRALR